MPRSGILLLFVSLWLPLRFIAHETCDVDFAEFLFVPSDVLSEDIQEGFCMLRGHNNSCSIHYYYLPMLVRFHFGEGYTKVKWG